jgi:hypothetical protein
LLQCWFWLLLCGSVGLLAPWIRLRKEQAVKLPLTRPEAVRQRPQDGATKEPTTDQFAALASLEDNGRKIQLDSEGRLAGLEELPEASRSLVRSALTTKTLSKAGGDWRS